MLLDASQPQTGGLAEMKANGNAALLGKPAVAHDGDTQGLDQPAAVPMTRRELRKQRRILARELRKAK
ncbi:MAG: hypothetical protein L0211_12260 [Planctomycetaceae bacterium]|nr:hypothetical protein [Planctomycetaceae bacterium]